MFYSTEINGYTFIVMASESSVMEEADISVEQLKWVDETITEATSTGKPVFVILHQPLKETHQVWQAWNSPDDNAGTVGDQSDALYDIMNKYNNVFLVTGHLHMGFSKEWTVPPIGNFWGINLPGIGPNNADGEYNESGTGYIMEVYDDRVEFIARDFNLGKYITEHNFTIEF